jgi:Domain of unknown function (DUF4123)
MVMTIAQVANPLEVIALQWLEGQAADVSEQIFLLFDQSAMPNVRSMWPAISGFEWMPVLGSADRQPDGGSPVLMDISQLSTSKPMRDVLRRMHREARLANCLSILKSPLDCRTLAQILHARTQLNLPDHLRVVLRFFDTRTLPLLPRLFGAAQYADFMSCVTAWHYLGRDGQARGLPAASVKPSVAGSTTPRVAGTVTSPAIRHSFAPGRSRRAIWH